MTLKMAIEGTACAFPDLDPSAAVEGIAGVRPKRPCSRDSAVVGICNSPDASHACSALCSSRYCSAISRRSLLKYLNILGASSTVGRTLGLSMLSGASIASTASAAPLGTAAESAVPSDTGNDSREARGKAEFSDALPSITTTTDVLVIGGGAAGLCAAIAAAENGASVILIEKMPTLGGDTLISGGYYNAVDLERQSKQSIVDSVELFESQILELGGGRNSKEVVHVLAVESLDTLSWLEKHGLVFLPQVFEVYGSMHPRAHKPVLPRGTGWIRALSQAAITEGVEIRTNVRAMRFIVDPRTGGVSGVVALQKMNGREILSAFRARRGVVVAAGGFGANKKLVAAASPAFAELPVDSQPGATGEMIEAARSVGASIVNMQFVECVPGSRAGIGFPIRLDYIPRRMIMVDRFGRRFTDEEADRTQIAAAIIKAAAPSWCLADADAVASFDAHEQKNLYRGLYMGEVFREKTPEALAAKLGMNPKVLKSTLRTREARERLKTTPLWATGLHLRVHSTLGGIAIDAKARALSPAGEPILHLYAAGSCVGNIHGKARIGANGLNAAAVFGRIAGTNAARNKAPSSLPFS